MRLQQSMMNLFAIWFHRQGKLNAVELFDKVWPSMMTWCPSDNIHHKSMTWHHLAGATSGVSSPRADECRGAGEGHQARVLAGACDGRAAGGECGPHEGVHGPAAARRGLDARAAADGGGGEPSSRRDGAAGRGVRADGRRGDGGRRRLASRVYTQCSSRLAGPAGHKACAGADASPAGRPGKLLVQLGACGSYQITSSSL